MSKKTIGSLLIRLGMDPRDADRSIKNFEKSLKETGKRMESVGRAMSIGFTAPFFALIAKGIHGYNEQAQATRRLTVALGGASDALLQQADALERVTLFEGDKITSTQAWAAALGHSEKQILQMTDAAVGLAAGLDIELQKAMEMLHKTTTGTAGALGKLIPEVKNMTEAQLRSGEAVALVEEKFRGFAEAAALTGSGPLVVLKHQTDALLDSLGEAFLPIVVALADKIKTLIAWFQALDPEVKRAAVTWGLLVAAIGPLLILIPKIVSMLAVLTGPIGLTVASIAALAAVALYVGYNWEVFKDQTLNIWDTIRRGVVLVVNDIIDAMNTLNKVTTFGIGKDAPKLNAPKAVGSGKSPVYKAFSQVMTETSNDIFNFIGGGDGLKKIEEANALMAKLGTSADNTGESFGGMEKRAKVMVAQIGELGNKAKEAKTELSAIWEALGFSDKMSLDSYLKHDPNQSSKDADEGIKGITPDMTGSLQAQSDALEEYQSKWEQVGGAVGGAVDTITQAMLSGENAFQAFGKMIQGLVLEMGKLLIKSLITAAIMNILFPGSTAAKGGLGAILQGAFGGVPKFASGGGVNGPTMALIGDNPSGKEMVLPFERTGEFAQMIGKQMGGGGGGELRARVAGRDLEFVLIQETQNSARMGRQTVSSF